MALTGEGYERIGDRNGVEVYKRNGHAIDLAAEGNIDAPPDVVLKVLTDYGSHPKWVHGLAVSRVLDKRDGALDVYQRLHLPMLDDRDFAMHVDWTRRRRRARDPLRHAQRQVPGTAGQGRGARAAARGQLAPRAGRRRHATRTRSIASAWSSAARCRCGWRAAAPPRTCRRCSTPSATRRATTSSDARGLRAGLTGALRRRAHTHAGAGAGERLAVVVAAAGRDAGVHASLAGTQATVLAA